MAPPFKRVLISMGDPAGIGPEVIVKCLARTAASAAATGIEPVVIGELALLEETAAALKLPVAFCPEGAPKAGAVRVESMGLLAGGDF